MDHLKLLNNCFFIFIFLERAIFTLIFKLHKIHNFNVYKFFLSFSQCCAIIVLHAQLLQLCPTLCIPMDCSPAGSSVHGILQGRIVEWVPVPFSRDLPKPKIKLVFLMSNLHCQMGSLPLEPLGSLCNHCYYLNSFFFFFLAVPHVLQDLSSSTRD